MRIDQRLTDLPNCTYAESGLSTIREKSSVAVASLAAPQQTGWSIGWPRQCMLKDQLHEARARPGRPRVLSTSGPYVLAAQLAEAFLLGFVHGRLLENAPRLDARQGLHRMNGVSAA